MDLFHVEEVSLDCLKENFDKRQISDLSIISYPKIFAYHLRDPIRYPTYSRYLPKKGARQWIQLSWPQAARNMQAMREELDQCSTQDDLLALGKKAGIIAMNKLKIPYLRIMDKSIELHEKFFYVDAGDAMKSTLARALDFNCCVESKKDAVACMLTTEVRQYLQSHGLEKQGPNETIRNRMLAHIISKCRGKWLCDKLPVKIHPSPSTEAPLKQPKEDRKSVV